MLGEMALALVLVLAHKRFKWSLVRKITTSLP